MKKSQITLFLLFLITMIAAIIFCVMYQNEKQKWSYLSEKLKDIKCGNVIIDSSYKVFTLDKCDYIILKKKGSKVNFNQNFNAMEEKSNKVYKTLGMGNLDSATAIRYIRYYNERYNSDLTNTSFIDFNNELIIKYLLDVKADHDKLDNFRLYLADYGDTTSENHRNRITAILTATIIDSGEYLADAKKETINYGGLCPPPSSYDSIKNAKSTLLWRAIDESQASRTVSRGNVIIKH